MYNETFPPVTLSSNSGNSREISLQESNSSQNTSDGGWELSGETWSSVDSLLDWCVCGSGANLLDDWRRSLDLTITNLTDWGSSGGSLDLTITDLTDWSSGRGGLDLAIADLSDWSSSRRSLNLTVTDLTNWGWGGSRWGSLNLTVADLSDWGSWRSLNLTITNLTNWCVGLLNLTITNLSDWHWRSLNLTIWNLACDAWLAVGQLRGSTAAC